MRTGQLAVGLLAGSLCIWLTNAATSTTATTSSGTSTTVAATTTTSAATTTTTEATTSTTSTTASTVHRKRVRISNLRFSSNRRIRAYRRTTARSTINRSRLLRRRVLARVQNRIRSRSMPRIIKRRRNRG
ncbi:protein new-glue 2 [Drosophila persimilis]|uniref:protein new-glue 2 n=1 Tax=Drosophila persimilis TaxID=7234 RepID=UPI000F084EE2|nr:protein new-glue 2 [Drosophila persimilis]